jgi:MFS family permease
VLGTFLLKSIGKKSESESNINTKIFLPARGDRSQMVLEHVFPEDWLEKKGRYAFILGVIYSVIGVLIASVLFPGDPALVAVAFTSLLLLPELYKIFSIEERKESIEQKISLRTLWRDDIDIVKIYVFLFLGILLVYSVGTILLPSFQTNTLFREQLEIRFGQGFAGNAIITSGLFFDLLSNNFLVLIACFILALLTGDGAIFLITWNASVWGTIFGVTAKNAGAFSGQNPFYLFGLIMLVVFPHMIIEGISYFLAAISGSVISKDVILEKFASHRFFEVFSINLYLFLFALVFLLLGAAVETFVLQHVGIYQEIIRMSMLAVGAG